MPRGTTRPTMAADEQAMLGYWQQTGFTPDHKITAWMAVSPSHAKTALWLTENLIFGLELPSLWVQEMPGSDGFVWTVAGDADPDNGHCFVGVGWDETGIKIDSWGLLGTITDAAVAKYVNPGSRRRALHRPHAGDPVAGQPEGAECAGLGSARLGL